MKTAISIPDDVFSRAERFARRRNITRSALFTVAIEEYIQHHRDEDGPVRAFDPELWIDPSGRLWWFWAQSVGHDGKVAGVWTVTNDEPNGYSGSWSEPRLTSVGKWVKRNAEAIYGEGGRCDGLFDWLPLGAFTRKGNTAYFRCHNWPGRELAIGGFKTKFRRASLLTDGKTLPFRQERDRLVIYGLPSSDPDKLRIPSVFCSSRVPSAGCRRSSEGRRSADAADGRFPGRPKAKPVRPAGF